MRPGDEQTANLLGALALVITDQGWEEIAAAGVLTGSDAAALSALHQFLDHPTLDRLRRVLGLTPSGAVRVVDRLAAAGLVARGPGGDGRSRSVRLTPMGRRTAARIARARMAYLGGLLTDLSAAENRTFGALLGKVMSEVVRAKDGGAWICRLCDLPACGRAEGNCPTANVAALRYATQPAPPGGQVPSAGRGGSPRPAPPPG